MRQIRLALPVRALVLVGLALAPAYLAASGSQEGAEPPTGVESEKTVPASPEEIAAAESEMKEILKSIGIQTFEGEIAAVDFAVPALGAGQVSLSDMAGEFVFLNFWATWCPPCREEMPSMDVLHTEMAERNITILAVNVQEGADVVGQFIDDHGYQFPVLLDESGRVASNYGVRGIPTTYFIGPSGAVLGRLVGTRYWDEAEILAGFDRIAALTESVSR